MRKFHIAKSSLAKNLLKKEVERCKNPLSISSLQNKVPSHRSYQRPAVQN
jgi:hypothetical protein